MLILKDGKLTLFPGGEGKRWGCGWEVFLLPGRITGGHYGGRRRYRVHWQPWMDVLGILSWSIVVL